MIDIYTPTGQLYKFDESTNRIIRNGIVVSSVEAEPVFSDVTNRSNPPTFAGVWLKTTGQIITRSGQIHHVSDVNAVL